MIYYDLKSLKSASRKYKEDKLRRTYFGYVKLNEENKISLDKLQQAKDNYYKFKRRY